jgi:hypothetical protein
MLHPTRLRVPYGDLFCALLALGAGVIAAWADFHVDEPQPAATLLILFGLMLGFARPHRAWLWGMISGLSIPLFYVLALEAGFSPRTIPEPNLLASALAVVPAILGAYGGAGISRFAHMAHG